VDAKFTETQGQYLSFIAHYIKLNGRSPAESDIQRYFKVTPPTVHQMVVKLDRLGLITRTPGVARSIRVEISPEDIPRLI
jgi:Mn-dependent DtxR family transcriptional regulator